MIRRLDAWIGTRLFHPPIIWLLQRVGISQYGLHRYIWWAVALWCVYTNNWHSWIWSTYIVIFALARTISAGLAPDRERQGSLWFRVVIMALTLFVAPDVMLGSDPVSRQSLAILLLQLVAEYAITIRTIPPRKRRERAPAAAESYI